ncbi:fungal specific transcription factor domain-containing protein [Aspergillus vadensis CBS 113365]|uniref:Uncharacterized protein n=1 Tax=Aspergillus vadensis (strain CBS 113365 / IMI 142717 / IBT 24658) TaxID=1448311 RepID=A0A319BHR3_ASPVC|nr:hypothetical protein BO88DRAFT_382829 [Aspergillus vadensis CBS 113365]PYH72177.1 hypothetical protein BO88DRAFT_382829 [Aspergillus vadensis CBS 113365]
MLVRPALRARSLSRIAYIRTIFDPATIAILDRLTEIQQSLSSLAPEGVTAALPLKGPPKQYTANLCPQTPQTVSLKIPAARICPDAILSWPIFQEVRLQTTLNSLILADHDHGLEEVTNTDVNLALIPDLIDRFLQFVHVKNPVVNTVVLRQSAVRIEVGESSQNAHSCLVDEANICDLSSDLRAELDIPDSILCEFNVSDGYPIPSSVSVTDSEAVLSGTPTDSEDLSHLWKLSTYYYLSDVALMRVEAQILNFMYSTNDSQWSPANLSYMCRTAADLESQIDHWSRNRPSIIHFEEWDSAPRFELTYNLQARVLQLRSWLYRPFVYYAIHHDGGQSNEKEEAERFMRKAIECSFHMINSKATQHRHHGTWFVARGVLSSALLIIAAVKANKGLVDYLADWPDLLDQAIRSLTHWASEARDLAYAAVVLANLKDKLRT